MLGNVGCRLQCGAASLQGHAENLSGLKPKTFWNVSLKLMSKASFLHG
jgi:hypothetical protein